MLRNGRMHDVSDGLLDWRSIQTLVRSMPDLHKTLIIVYISGDWKDGDATIHELAMTTEHAPFRHRHKIKEVGGQKKKQKTGWNGRLKTATIRDDELSKRIFFAGLFGLPWLQLVHSMGYYANQRGNEVSTESGPFSCCCCYGRFIRLFVSMFLSSHPSLFPLNSMYVIILVEKLLKMKRCGSIEAGIVLFW